MEISWLGSSCRLPLGLDQRVATKLGSSACHCQIIVFKSLNKQEVAQIAELEFRTAFRCRAWALQEAPLEGGERLELRQLLLGSANPFVPVLICRKVFKLCVEKGIKLSMTDRFKKKAGRIRQQPDERFLSK